MSRIGSDPPFWSSRERLLRARLGVAAGDPEVRIAAMSVRCRAVNRVVEILLWCVHNFSLLYLHFEVLVISPLYMDAPRSICVSISQAGDRPLLDQILCLLLE